MPNLRQGRRGRRQGTVGRQGPLPAGGRAGGCAHGREGTLRMPEVRQVVHPEAQGGGQVREDRRPLAGGDEGRVHGEGDLPLHRAEVRGKRGLRGQAVRPLLPGRPREAAAGGALHRRVLLQGQG